MVKSQLPFLVIRRAVLQEDEGREHLIAAFWSRSHAETWIANQEDQYFRPSDYYIVEKTND